MAAILGLTDAQVEAICREISGDAGVVQPANYNAPGQLVIAGHARAVDLAVAACKEAGAKRAMTLAVSAPFHSSLMQPAAVELGPVLEAHPFAAPAFPVVQNVNATACTDPAEIRKNLVAQVDSAVLWSATIQTLASQGVTRIVECGPGKVLAGLNRRIDKSLESLSVGDAASLAATLGEPGMCG